MCSITHLQPSLLFKDLGSMWTHDALHPHPNASGMHHLSSVGSKELQPVQDGVVFSTYTADCSEQCQSWSAWFGGTYGKKRRTKRCGEGRAPDAFWEAFISNPSHWWKNWPHKVRSAPLQGVRVHKETRRKNRTEGQLAKAVDALGLLVCGGLDVADSAFYTVIKSCIAQKDLVLGRRVHSLILQGGYGSNKFLANHIICMYSAHSMLEEAVQAFTKVPAPNCYMWASIIMAHARHGQPMQAIKLYRQMRESATKPDNHIYVAVLKACGTAEDLFSGREIHTDILENTDEANMHVLNCLVDMYAKCGSLEDARAVFDNLPAKDVVTWTAMIAGYAQHAHGQEALTLYARMEHESVIPADAVTFVCLLQACGSVAGLQKGKEIHAHVAKLGFVGTDIFLSNALIDMYCKCGSMADAQGVFDGLPRKDIVTWSALIAGYACQGESEHVFNVFQRMEQQGLQPNEVTFLSVLTVCSSVGLLDKGQKYFESMTRDYGLMPAMEHYTCMVDLFGRSGQVHKALEMVKATPFQPSGGVWRCVLAACQKWNAVDVDMMRNIYVPADMEEHAS